MELLSQINLKHITVDVFQNRSSKAIAKHKLYCNTLHNMALLSQINIKLIIVHIFQNRSLKAIMVSFTFRHEIGLICYENKSSFTEIRKITFKGNTTQLWIILNLVTNN